MEYIFMEITSRQSKILTCIVQQYIQTAEPVSSKLLGESDFPHISSATIRNEMNELESQGYLIQLHTSGGRVPTDKAYRYYVDNLLGAGEIALPTAVVKRIKEVIGLADQEPRELNKTVADLVRDLSDNMVVTGIFEEDDFYKTGLASLFEFPEFREIDRIFNIANIFDHFEKVFTQIEREVFANLDSDFRVFIGKENLADTTKGETVIVARYHLPDEYTGSLTVIGPTRMDYERSLGVVRQVVREVNQKVKKL